MIVDTKDISVIAQGPVDGVLTKECLEGVRRHLPGAQIILSTWRGSDISGLDYDDLVLSEDPGGNKAYRDSLTLHNVNRQITSTKSGLNKATRKYILKIRSDLILKNANFLRYYNKYQYRNAEYKLFENRVLISNLYTRKPSGKAYLFHPSDWVAFGVAEDIVKLWDIPLMPIKDLEEYDLSEDFRSRYTPEQYIWVSALGKAYSLDFKHHSHYSPENELISSITMINNFTVLNYNSQFGLSFKKFNPRINTVNIMYFKDWLADYKKYYEQDLKIDASDRLESNGVYTRYSLKISELHNKKRLSFKDYFNLMRYTIIVVITRLLITTMFTKIIKHTD